MKKDNVLAEIAPIIDNLIAAYNLFKPRKISFVQSFLHGPSQMHFFDKAYLKELVKKNVRVLDYIKKRVPPENDKTQVTQVVNAVINNSAHALLEMNESFSLTKLPLALKDVNLAVKVMEDCELIIDNEELFNLSEKYEFADMLNGSVPKEYYERRDEILRLLLEAQTSLKRLIALTKQ